MYFPLNLSSSRAYERFIGGSSVRRGPVSRDNPQSAIIERHHLVAEWSDGRRQEVECFGLGLRWLAIASSAFQNHRWP
jgi:hypothetical protein